MKAKQLLLVVGVLLILMGVVFASQGAGMLGTGSLMDNNPTWIYIGSALAILGALLVAFGLIPRSANQAVPTS